MSAPTGDGTQRRRRRDVDGIVLLDKPQGMSSNQALQRVRWLLNAAKGGHAGTLDPMATGMLPLCFGQATKACGQLLGSRKCYRARIELGHATDTGDADGCVVAEAPVVPLDEAAIGRTLAAFTGPIAQVPPMYSALKRDGRPLYELARRGECVARDTRQVAIDRLTLVSWGERHIEVEVTCSKGTYIRVLGEDMARALGTCGHLGELRRLWVEPFEGAAMTALDTIEQWVSAGGQDPQGHAWLLPVDRAFAALPRLDLDPARSLQLRQGRALAAGLAGPAEGKARAYGPDGGFLGLVAVGGDGTVCVERLFVPGAGAEEPLVT